MVGSNSPSCSLLFYDTGPQPVAVIVNYDDGLKQADSTGSVGSQLRLLIRRGLQLIEQTPDEANTGTNQINYTASLQNGDQLCVQASYNGFLTLDEDCKTIPTPNFGFVPIT